MFSKVTRLTESFGFNFDISILMASIESESLEPSIFYEEPSPAPIDPETSRQMDRLRLTFYDLSSPSFLPFKKIER